MDEQAKANPLSSQFSVSIKESGYQDVKWIELVRNRVGYNGGSLISWLFNDVVSTADMRICMCARVCIT